MTRAYIDNAITGNHNKLRINSPNTIHTADVNQRNHKPLSACLRRRDNLGSHGTLTARLWQRGHSMNRLRGSGSIHPLYRTASGYLCIATPIFLHRLVPMRWQTQWICSGGARQGFDNCGRVTSRLCKVRRGRNVAARRRLRAATARRPGMAPGSPQEEGLSMTRRLGLYGPRSTRGTVDSRWRPRQQ